MFRSYTPITIKLRVKNRVKGKKCILCHIAGMRYNLQVFGF